jgi:hypothetical protein
MLYEKAFSGGMFIGAFVPEVRCSRHLPLWWRVTVGRNRSKTRPRQHELPGNDFGRFTQASNRRDCQFLK